MAVKPGNRIVPITLPPYHFSKLQSMCERYGLTKSSAIQRMIEELSLPAVDSPESRVVADGHDPVSTN